MLAPSMALKRLYMQIFVTQGSVAFQEAFIIIEVQTVLSGVDCQLPPSDEHSLDVFLNYHCLHLKDNERAFY